MPKAGSILVAVRKPTPQERKEGAEVAFDRKLGGRTFTVYACRCYESWQQWGATESELWDNVPEVERWRHPNVEDCR